MTLEGCGLLHETPVGQWNAWVRNKISGMERGYVDFMNSSILLTSTLSNTLDRIWNRLIG